MTGFYEEIVRGESLKRLPPGRRHELICEKLHEIVGRSMVASSRLLPPRSIIELVPGTLLRPDLVVVTALTHKPWLIAEVVDSTDHGSDTVTKKMVYEETGLPRLWMVDPRYNNVEVYHGTPYGLSLRHMLAGRQVLTEKLLPELQLPLTELFGL
ncbi:MAG: Uma2 family endonuclease [Verrucomicrobia subdivision 3 bacterium]|nr:Uma2 family endonuclease [Limisphaerales bacterium]